MTNRAAKSIAASATERQWLPIEVSNLDIAFPAQVMHLMPPMKEIPTEFKEFLTTKWNRLVSDWFFSGVSNLKFTPKAGIDKDKALRHIKAILGSFEPQHEHKEAACAYLMSLWFDDVTWDKAKRKEK